MLSLACLILIPAFRFARPGQLPTREHLEFAYNFVLEIEAGNSMTGMEWVVTGRAADDDNDDDGKCFI